jgi:spermidine synthase
VDVVARAESERGEVVLGRRVDDGAVELRVNGVFVMDDLETSTERLLARTTVEALAASSGGAGAWRVVVGGLGLGYTLAEVLAEPRVASVLVAEIEPDLVDWHHGGLVPGSPLAGAAGGLVELVVGDVRDVVAGLPPGSVDLILLDVDNGPDFLVYNENSTIYSSDFFSTCRAKLRADGVLTVWSSSSSEALESAVTSVFGACVVKPVPVELQGRAETYFVYQGCGVQGCGVVHR